MIRGSSRQYCYTKMDDCEMDRDIEYKACLLYLTQYLEISSGNPKSRIEMTPFHTAMTSGDLDFVEKVLDNLQNPDLQLVVLNAPLISMEQFANRTIFVPPKLIYLSHILHRLAPEEIKEVSKGMTIMEDLTSHMELFAKTERGLYFELPLALACSSGNPDLVRAMLARGTRLKTCDSTSDNVIHSLVRLSQKAPRRALAMYSLLMEEICDGESKTYLLRTPNSEGKLPIDLAAKLGLPEMLKAIINTEGVYKFNMIDHGVVRLIRYDVTDYESDEAKTHKSLLYHLTDFDEHQLARAQKCRLLSSEPFNTWIQTKFNSKKTVMWTCIIYWLLLVTLFSISAIQLVDVGEPHAMVLVINFLLAFFYLAVEASHSRANMREITMSVKNMFINGHIPVTFTFAYRFFQIAFAFLLIVTTLLKPLQCYSPDFVLGLFVVCAFLCGLSLLFFMQLQPHVGHLLIVLQKVIFDTLFLLFMMFLYCIAFSVSLFLLHAQVTPTKCMAHRNKTSTTMEKCRDNIVSFSNNFFEAIYETLLLMFSVMAPRDIMFSCARIPAMAIALYIGLLVIVSIILVNLLIAIMTKRIDEISKMKDDILKLEKVSIVLYMEERVKTKIATAAFKYFHAVVDAFRRKCKCIKVKPEKSDHKSFVRNRAEGKIYLYTVQHRLAEEDMEDLQT